MYFCLNWTETEVNYVYCLEWSKVEPGQSVNSAGTQVTIAIASSFSVIDQLVPDNLAVFDLSSDICDMMARKG